MPMISLSYSLQRRLIVTSLLKSLLSGGREVLREVPGGSLL
jgi:hypothetical protein